MFIRILIITILSFFSVQAFANGYCDSRPSQAERERCYRNAPSMNRFANDSIDKKLNRSTQTLKQYEGEVLGSSKLSKEEKDEFKTKQANWKKKLETCGDNKQCRYNQTSDRVVWIVSNYASKVK